MGQYEEDIEIAVGTLSALAFVYSFMQTWGWSKRAGKPCYTNSRLPHQVYIEFNAIEFTMWSYYKFQDRFKIQGCPEATAHGDIASYLGHLRPLFFCKIKEIFVHTK